MQSQTCSWTPQSGPFGIHYPTKPRFDSWKNFTNSPLWLCMKELYRSSKTLVTFQLSIILIPLGEWVWHYNTPLCAHQRYTALFVVLCIFSHKQHHAFSALPNIYTMTSYSFHSQGGIQFTINFYKCKLKPLLGIWFVTLYPTSS